MGKYMNKIALASAALVLVLAGAANAAPRSHNGFSRVAASAGTDVRITVGRGFSVDVSGRDADRIVTRVSGDTLVVEPERNWRSRRHDAVVTITMPEIDGLDASSGAHIAANGLSSGDVTLGASSGARVQVAGSCARVDADVSSGADLDASELQCQNGAAEASSGGRVRVNATGRLDVDASSGGRVIAYGDPSIGNISLSSGGALRRAS